MRPKCRKPAWISPGGFPRAKVENTPYMNCSAPAFTTDQYMAAGEGFLVRWSRERSSIEASTLNERAESVKI